MFPHSNVYILKCIIGLFVYEFAFFRFVCIHCIHWTVAFSRRGSDEIERDNRWNKVYRRTKKMKQSNECMSMSIIESSVYTHNKSEKCVSLHKMEERQREKPKSITSKCWKIIGVVSCESNTSFKYFFFFFLSFHHSFRSFLRFSLYYIFLHYSLFHFNTSLEQLLSLSSIRSDFDHLQYKFSTTYTNKDKNLLFFSFNFSNRVWLVQFQGDWVFSMRINSVLHVYLCNKYNIINLPIKRNISLFRFIYSLDIMLYRQ